MPAVGEHLTANNMSINVSNSVDETSLVKNNQDNDFIKFNYDNKISVTLNNHAVNDNQVITETYVDQFQQEKERSRRNVGFEFLMNQVF